MPDGGVLGVVTLGKLVVRLPVVRLPVVPLLVVPLLVVPPVAGLVDCGDAVGGMGTGADDGKTGDGETVV